MEFKERSQVLVALGREIATHLNRIVPLRPWTFVEPDEDSFTVYLRNAGAGRIYLQLTSSKGYDLCDRVQVSGWLNVGKNHSYVDVRGTNNERRTGGEITIARERGAEAIAKDIAKRFLPEYFIVLEMAQDIVKKNAEYEAKITANLTKLANLAKFRIYPSNSSDVQSKASGSIGTTHVAITAHSDGARLELSSLTVSQAATIIRYLNKWA